jgi:hypothetical protein
LGSVAGKKASDIYIIEFKFKEFSKFNKIFNVRN